MDIQKTMEFILEQQAHAAALHAQYEAWHAKHETRDAEHEARRAEHDADIKEIRRLLSKGSALRVQDRQQVRKHGREIKEIEREIKQLRLENAKITKELKQEMKAFLRWWRGSSGNGSSHKK